MVSHLLCAGCRRFCEKRQDVEADDLGDNRRERVQHRLMVELVNDMVAGIIGGIKTATKNVEVEFISEAQSHYFSFNWSCHVDTRIIDLASHIRASQY